MSHSPADIKRMLENVKSDAENVVKLMEQEKYDEVLTLLVNLRAMATVAKQNLEEMRRQKK